MAKILEWKLGSLCLPACLCMSTGIYILCVCVFPLYLWKVLPKFQKELCVTGLKISAYELSIPKTQKYRN